jgi:hypothetical protein
MMGQQEAAETLALKALGWLAGQEDLLGTFLGASGLSRDEIALRAAEPEFLGALLDFLLMDDAWVKQFCDAEGLGYDAPMQARRALPGGEEINWT